MLNCTISPDIPGKRTGGPPGSRTRHQRIMRTTMAFATPFGFVVWTVSCLYDLPVQSLHVLPHKKRELRSGSPRRRLGQSATTTEVSPNLSSSTERQSELTSRQPNRCVRTPASRRTRPAKSAALTRHELEALHQTSPNKKTRSLKGRASLTTGRHTTRTIPA